MKHIKLPLFLLTIITCNNLFAQDYDSYFLGNATDLDTNGQGGICMMGGATEDDNGMIWFLERANQGDVLVLRASGSDGYNDYMLNQLGVTINSVETIVFNNANASNATYIHDAIEEAEAIWFAGGDQWIYISYWRDTAIDSLINEGIQNRGLVVGGTSAGMAILGGYYFSAENGTVTSATALADPYNNNVTVDNTPFLDNQILSDVITDTHYDDPDRKGRHITFMARMVVDRNEVLAKGIACDEYTAVCIDENGIAKVYGGYPTYDDNAYFIQVNCDNLDTGVEPETCTSGNPLDWNKQGHAVQVYKIQGTAAASNSFDLNDWFTASGGSWERWWVDTGTLNEDTSVAIDCTLGLEESESTINIYPNPTTDLIKVEGITEFDFQIHNTEGKEVLSGSSLNGTVDISNLSSGSYILNISSLSGSQHFRFVKR